MDAFREKLGPPIGYAYSGRMMQRIEAHFSRSGWQQRFVEGTPVINLLMETLGCGPLIAPGRTMGPNRFTELSTAQSGGQD